MIITVDPEFLTQEDIAKVFAGADVCRFTFTKTSPPVLVTNDNMALVRISGDLVRLAPLEGSYEAGPVNVAVIETDETGLHDLIIRAVPDYEAGFRGQFTCAK